MRQQDSNDPLEELTETELEHCLAQWPPPNIPVRLEAEVRAAYRRAFPPRPWWRRWLTASVRVPVPLAAAAGLVFGAALWLAVHLLSRWPPPPMTTMQRTKFVEVPLVQERLVPRVVYVSPKPGANEHAKLPANALHRKPQTTQADLAGFRPVSEIRLEVSQGDQEP